MRVSNWNPQRYDGEFIGASMDRLRKAANVIKDNAEVILKSKIGRGKTTGIAHGPYKTGQYAGQPWTARVPGSLVNSLRVVEKEEDRTYAAILGKHRNVRVYAGNYLAWWANIFEYYQPYLRPAVNKSKAQINEILRNG